jgi:hypothetical protein
VLAAKPNPPTLAASTKAAPARTPRVTAKASTPSPLPSAYTLGSTPVERRIGPAAY